MGSPVYLRRRVTHVLARDCVDHIIRGSAEELSDDGELVDVVLAREQRLALEHFCEDAAGAPDINLNVVLLPREHDLGGTVVPRGNVSGHLGVLDTGKAEVADLQIAILVDEDVAGLQVAMHDAGGVDVFQSTLMSD